MTSRRVWYLPAARLEAAEALEWYLKRSVEAGSAFVAELGHAVSVAASDPRLWPEFEVGTRRYVLRRFPFNLIYREVQGGIQVVAVAHQKRKPGYWHHRPDA